MILYNITFNIEPEIQQEWLAWMKKYYFPYILSTKLFADLKIYRLLNEIENQGITYSIQFFSDSLENVNTYLEEYASNIVAEHNEAFKHRHVSFMTILEHVELASI